MEPSTQEIKFRRPTRVFIVEDERLVVEDLRVRLQNRGYDVVGTAGSGTEAIQEITKVHPDVIIMDVRIKGELNGIEVAIIVQSHFDETIPVVFLTGFSEKTFGYLKVLDQYIYLNKPFREDQLVEAIERALKKSRSAETIN
jgi:two-component SAPR family response regulator